MSIAWGNAILDASLLYILDLIATCFSLLGSSIMFYYCYKSQSRSVPVKLLLATAIGDLLYSISNLMSAFETSDTTKLCVIEAFLREFSIIFMAFMLATMAVVCHTASKLEDTRLQEKVYRKGVCFSIVLGIIFAFGPAYVPQLIYDNEVITCWIGPNPDYPKTSAELISISFQAVPIVVAMLIMLVSYYYAIMRVKQLPDMLVDAVGSRVYRLLWYPIIPLVALIPGLVDVCMRLMEIKSEPAWIPSLHLVLIHSIGFIDAIVYGVQMGILKRRKQRGESFVYSKNTGDSALYPNSFSVSNELMLAHNAF